MRGNMSFVRSEIIGQSDERGGFCSGSYVRLCGMATAAVPKEYLPEKLMGCTAEQASSKALPSRQANRVEKCSGKCCVSHPPAYTFEEVRGEKEEILLLAATRNLA